MTTAPKNHVLDDAARAAALTQLDGWTLDEQQHFHKTFVFADFPAAMAFMTRAAFDAERLCHHPNWSNVYNRVEVTLWSHDHGGVSKLCVDLAAAMDRASGPMLR